MTDKLKKEQNAIRQLRMRERRAAQGIISCSLFVHREDIPELRGIANQMRAKRMASNMKPNWNHDAIAPEVNEPVEA